jgi:hypothetical protein
MRPSYASESAASSARQSEARVSKGLERRKHELCCNDPVAPISSSVRIAELNHRHGCRPMRRSADTEIGTRALCSGAAEQSASRGAGPSQTCRPSARSAPRRLLANRRMGRRAAAVIPPGGLQSARCRVPRETRRRQHSGAPPALVARAVTPRSRPLRATQGRHKWNQSGCSVPPRPLSRAAKERPLPSTRLPPQWRRGADRFERRRAPTEAPTEAPHRDD